MGGIKVEREGFVWLLVTNIAREVQVAGIFDLYILYSDDSESKVDSFSQLTVALGNGLEIGIEVGFIYDSIKPLTESNSQLDLQQEIVNKAGINIVTCGNCGDVIFHRLPVDRLGCPSCTFEEDSCHFPDLNY